MSRRCDWVWQERVAWNLPGVTGYDFLAGGDVDDWLLWGLHPLLIVDWWLSLDTDAGRAINWIVYDGAGEGYTPGLDVYFIARDPFGKGDYGDYSLLNAGPSGQSDVNQLSPSGFQGPNYLGGVSTLADGIAFHWWSNYGSNAAMNAFTGPAFLNARARPRIPLAEDTWLKLVANLRLENRGNP